MKPFLRIVYFLFCGIFLFSCASTNESKQIDSSVLVQEYILLSNTYAELEKHEEALELLLKAEAYSPENRELLYLIGRSAALSENWSIAIDYYTTLLNFDNENLLLQKSIAWVYAQSGNLITASNLYKTLYASHSYDKEICTNYILTLVANGENELANEIFQEYAKRYPEESNIEELQEKILNKDEQAVKNEIDNDLEI